MGGGASSADKRDYVNLVRVSWCVLGASAPVDGDHAVAAGIASVTSFDGSSLATHQSWCDARVAAT